MCREFNFGNTSLKHVMAPLCGLLTEIFFFHFPLRICHKPKQDLLSFPLTLKWRPFYSNMWFECLNDSRDIQHSKLRNCLSIIMQMTSCGDRQMKGWNAEEKASLYLASQESQFVQSLNLLISCVLWIWSVYTDLREVSVNIINEEFICIFIYV